MEIIIPSSVNTNLTIMHNLINEPFTEGYFNDWFINIWYELPKH